MNKLKFVMFALISTALFFGSCKDESKEKPTLTVTFKDNIDTGWYDDEITLMVEVESEAAFSIDITNNHDTQELSETFEAGGTTKAWAYVIPNDLAEGDEVKVTVVATNTESGLSETVEKIIKISTSGGNGETITHKGTTTANEVWLAQDTHYVDGTFYISGYTVTIEPGTVIKMNAGASIQVGKEQNSKLLAQGTAAKPITITSAKTDKAPGDWEYIFFDEGTLSTTILEYCNFEYGGGDSYYSYMIGMKNCEISVNNCSFKYSASKGFRLTEGAKFKTFTTNTLSDCSDHLVSLEPDAVSTLLNTSTYTSTLNKGILIDADANDSYTLTAGIWKKQTVPYYINSALYIESSAGAQLIVDAGTTFKMMADTRIYIGYNYSGEFIAAGTSAQPITFTSALNEQAAGDWRSIWFGEMAQSTSKLEYCVIDYAGGDSYYDFAVKINKTKIKIKNSTIRNSASSGIELDDAAEFVEFTNNTIESCALYPIEIEPNAIHTIGAGNTLTTTNFGVHLLDVAYTQLTEKTWPALTCAYIVDKSISIGTADGGGAILRIAAGASFKMKANSSFTIGSNAATVYFEGTAQNPITFTTGYASPQAGQWDFIRFEDNLQPGSKMAFCNVSYGGADSYYKGNIVLSTNNLTVQNCKFENSKNFGLYRFDTYAPANADWQTVNTFTNNGTGNWNEPGK